MDRGLDPLEALLGGRLAAGVALQLSRFLDPARDRVDRVGAALELLHGVLVSWNPRVRSPTWIGSSRSPESPKAAPAFRPTSPISFRTTSLFVTPSAYDLLHDIDARLVEGGHSRLEELLDSAGFSGLISRTACDGFAKHSRELVNSRYPDLLPRLAPPGRLRAGERPTREAGWPRGQVKPLPHELAIAQPTRRRVLHPFRDRH